MRIAAHSRLICGMACEISSGISSRWALYAGNMTCRGVGADVSSATARCVGCWFLVMSNSVFAKPYSAEVFTPSLVMIGERMKAKCAR